MKKSIAAAAVLVCIVVAAAAAAAIFLNKGEGDDATIDLDNMPEGLREIEVKVNEGGKWELNGLITTNAVGRNDTAAVIVHGSGPVDMDCSVYGQKPYRDLAWGLALFDIDVLRYDKRTSVYGNSSFVDRARATVMEETVDDAVAAAGLLRGLGYERIFLIGHSLGGMLGPIIVSESKGLFDGFISLAGSPRILPEISADQCLALTTPQNSASMEIYVKAEQAKLDRLSSMTESELQSTTIFGLRAYYIKDMIGRDAAGTAVSLDVPMLFLQGSADFQVYADRDFVMWKEILDGKEGVEFKLYNGLNHFFMVSKGPNAGTIEEYYLKGHVSLDVIGDIAEFINR
ncbi:MAG: alpha/beta hydrolase [Methanomassiliicoccaceae archaeon]|nr:alpha/beta hydrolase [Methanomassiliicoccaceae archaeon]